MVPVGHVAKQLLCQRKNPASHVTVTPVVWIAALASEVTDEPSATDKSDWAAAIECCALESEAPKAEMERP